MYELGTYYYDQDLPPVRNDFILVSEGVSVVEGSGSTCHYTTGHATLDHIAVKAKVAMSVCNGISCVRSRRDVEYSRDKVKDDVCLGMFFCYFCPAHHSIQC